MEACEVPLFGRLITRQRVLAAMENMRARPIILAAPSGYGKSAVAAQYSALPAFSRRIWIACDGAIADPSSVATLVHSGDGVLSPMTDTAPAAPRRRAADVSAGLAHAVVVPADQHALGQCR